MDGRIKGVYPTMVDGVQLKGPDTPGISATSVKGTDWTVPRSGGYEGMALQPGQACPVEVEGYLNACDQINMGILAPPVATG